MKILSKVLFLSDSIPLVVERCNASSDHLKQFHKWMIAKLPLSKCLPDAQVCCTQANSNSPHGFVQDKNKCFLGLLQLIEGGKTTFPRPTFQALCLTARSEMARVQALRIHPVAVGK